MLESITLLIIKEKIIDGLSIIKKYWQFFLGISVAIVFFIITRDSSKAQKAIQKLRESSKDERDRSLEIQENNSDQVENAIDKFTEDINNAVEDIKVRNETIDLEKDKIIDELLKNESEERGSIASEVSETLNKI